MNEKETAEVLALLKTAYPASYREISKSDAEAIVSLWHTMFSDTDAAQVKTAVVFCIANNKFAPTVAEVKDYIASLTQPERLTASEAFHLVKLAINGPNVHQGPSGLDYSEAYAKLPEDIRHVLGSPSRLREYANMQLQEFNTWEFRNFAKSFEARQTKQIEYEKLPESVRNISAQIAKKKAIGDGK